MSDSTASFFPDLNTINTEIVAVGGDLSTDKILAAYHLGIFPWFNDDNHIMWWYPHKRMVLFLEKFKISKSLKKILNKNIYQIKIDSNFSAVIKNCRQIVRKDQDDSWITDEMEAAYNKLHKMGYAHCVEIYEENKLVGGIYGLVIGKYFSGESMFSLKTNTSKIALANLIKLLQLKNYDFIDCQIHTEHLESLGAELISKDSFKNLLNQALAKQEKPQNWNHYEKLLTPKNIA